jgi:hypothetical protein
VTDILAMSVRWHGVPELRDACGDLRAIALPCAPRAG